MNYKITSVTVCRDILLTKETHLSCLPNHRVPPLPQGKAQAWPWFLQSHTANLLVPRQHGNLGVHMISEEFNY